MDDSIAGDSRINQRFHHYDVGMETTVRASIARVSVNALVAAALCTLVAGVGAASAGAATPPTECLGLQAALNGAASSGGTIVLSGMCSGSYTIPRGAAFTLEGAPGTTSGFDGVNATGPLLGNVASTEAGAMTLSHLTFEHAKDFSALSIRASRVTLSDDSFLENEEQGASEHAAFVGIGPSDCPPTGTSAIAITGSTFLETSSSWGTAKEGAREPGSKMPATRATCSKATPSRAIRSKPKTLMPQKNWK